MGGATLGSSYINIHFNNVPRAGFQRLGRSSGAWSVTGTDGTAFMFKVLGTSGGGGGCTCDWNNVPFINLKGNMILDAITPTSPDPKQYIEIRSDPYSLVNWNNILDFMRQYDSGSLAFDDPNSAALKFKSLTGGGLTASLFQVNFNVNTQRTGICCSHSFVVRKDILATGMLQSIEGEIVLHSGKYNGVQMRTWGIERRNPLDLSMLDPSYRPFIQAANDKDTTVQAIDFIGPSIELPAGVYGHKYIPIYTGGVYTAWLEALPGLSGIRFKSPLLDGNGDSGLSGQVLTSRGGVLAPIWQTGSGGGSSNVKSGQVTTDASGSATVTFLTPAFGSEPSITCTIKDANGRPITAIITAASASGFTVKTMVHKHFVAELSATASYPGSSSLNYYRKLMMRNQSGSAPISLEMYGLANSSTSSANNIYTGPMSENGGNGTTQELIGNITVNWIATPKTQ